MKNEQMAVKTESLFLFSESWRSLSMQLKDTLCLKTRDWPRTLNIAPRESLSQP